MSSPTCRRGGHGAWLRDFLVMAQTQLSVGYRRTPQAPRRDEEIVEWIARLGAASVDQVRRRFGLGRTVGYRRVAALVAAGLLARRRVLVGRPAMLVATRQGLRWLGLPFDVARVSPGLLNHWLVCGEVAITLEARHGRDSLMTERELRLEEQRLGRPVASAPLAPDRSGRRPLHRPDFAIRGSDRPSAVEVELTVKAPRRLERILAGWRRARHVEEAIYLCAPPVVEAVERAVKKTRSEGRVRVAELGGLAL